MHNDSENTKPDPTSFQRVHGQRKESGRNEYDYEMQNSLSLRNRNYYYSKVIVLLSYVVLFQCLLNVCLKHPRSDSSVLPLPNFQSGKTLYHCLLLRGIKRKPHVSVVTHPELPADTALCNFLWHLGKANNCRHIDMHLTKPPNCSLCMT